MSADGDRVLTDRKLSESAYDHVIDVPFEQVDIAGWLFSLPNAEYERCCAPTTSPAATRRPTTASRCRSTSSGSAAR